MSIQESVRQIEYVAGMLSKAIDKDALKAATQLARNGERLYEYEEIVQSAGMACLRWYHGAAHYFDGQLWRELEDVVLSTALRKALVACAGRGNSMIKPDVVASENKLLNKAVAGAKLSPLGVSPSVVGFRNCVVDFTDIDKPVIHSFKDQMPVVNLLPYDYDVQAGCPTWTSFLQSVLPKKDRIVLQKYMGLGCVDRTKMAHKVEETLWLLGNGKNGKSTICNVIKNVFGVDNVSTVSLDKFLFGNTDTKMWVMASIEGKSINLCQEMQLQDLTKGADTYKSLCSGEEQDARFLRENVRRITRIPFFVFATNALPKLPKGDKALLRRLVLIEFRTSVSDEDMDRELGKKLERELSGIRNWCIEGYKMLVADGFSFMDKGSSEKMQTSIMANNEDTVSIFTGACGMQGTRPSGHWDVKPQYVRGKVMYEEYCHWCQREEYESVSNNQFGRDMGRLGFGRVRRGAGVFYVVFADKDLEFGIRE